MAIATIGQENSGDRRTPTLRQYIKNNDGRYPIQSNVKVIFKPNKFGGHTFITDHDFKVQLEQGSATDELMTLTIETLMEEEATLVIQPVVSGKKISFLVGQDTDQNSSWQEFDWGWKCSLLPPKKPDRKKSQSPKLTPPSEPPNMVS